MRRDWGKRIIREVARRTLSPGPVAGMALGALLGAGGLYYAREVEPADVEVVPVSLIVPRLDARFDGYRIAQISDLHADGWMSPGRLLRLVRLVNAEAPDLVAITGDFATYSSFRSLIRYVPGLVAPLSRFHAPDGVIAVLGNHDHITDASVVRRSLAAAGVIELRDAVRSVRRDDAALHLCGIDSVLKDTTRLDRMLRDTDIVLKASIRLDRMLQGLPERGAAILLVHEPDFADTSAKTGRFDLQLSGHSHGGQVGLSPLRQVVLPPLSHKYPDGLYRVGKMILYTNRGLGNHPRLRLGCRPEITVFTLRSSKPSTGQQIN